MNTIFLTIAVSALYLTVPEPVISELGLSVGETGLLELAGKVKCREDAECSAAERTDVTFCKVKRGTEIYWMTDNDHPAHPAVLFRGYVESENGLRLEERGWYAGDAGAAIDFFNNNRAGDLQPKRS